MSTDLKNPGKLAFSTRCLPGSIAEQKEAERLAEFQRNKAIRLAEEKRNKPEADAKRHQEYLDACKANDERMRRDKAARARPSFPRP